jgi:2-keto-4-pentenoate hydratase
VNNTSPDQFAAELIERYRRREKFTLAMPDGRAHDLEYAYAVQARLVTIMQTSGTTCTGYKIALTTPRMQCLCSVDEPVMGIILSDRVHHSPAQLVAKDFVRCSIESEIAFRFERMPPADPEALRKGDLLDYVGEVCAAFEPVEDHEADYKHLSAATLVCENAWNAGLVCGPSRPMRGTRSLAGLRGVLKRDGAIVDSGTSSDVLGDPANALEWLYRHLASRGMHLNAGDWVTTGAVIPTHVVVSGENYKFEIEGFEPVTVAIV